MSTGQSKNLIVFYARRQLAAVCFLPLPAAGDALEVSGL
jgi:hypothetical protein